MKHFIRWPEFPNHKASSHIVNELLGLRDGQKLPVEGMPPRTIQGIKVWVTPLVIPNPTKGKRSTHRVLAECPECGRTMSVGRLHQHICKGET